MRKRIRKLIAKATPKYAVILQQDKKPYVKIFGKWTKIQESDLPLYKDFKIEWK